MWDVQLFKLNFDEQEIKAVTDVIKSGWITMGQKTKEFETGFSKLLNEKEVMCTAVTNCTAALHVALLALDIKAGDEVIIPALTFVADLNVVRMVGANPVLADCSNYNDWNVSANTIESVITEKTKAVIIVHYAGVPCQMDEIVALCKSRKIALIEDCAHAPGAQFNGNFCGTFGDIGCFSFFTNKNLSVGEGGMVSTKSADLHQKIKYLISHGMTSLTLDRHKGRSISYDVVQSGLNYRIDEMRSALGCVQLNKLLSANQRRKQISDIYVRELINVDGIIIPFQNMANIHSANHIFPILLDKEIDRISFIEKLKEDKIQSSIHYPAFREFTINKEIDLNDAPIAEDISNRELTLPLYPTMTADEAYLVINAVKKNLIN